MAELICGIHLGGESLSALALRIHKRELTLAGGAVVPLQQREAGGAAAPAPGDAEEEEPAGADGSELILPLRQAARAMHLHQGEVVLSLPKQQGIMRSVVFPSNDPDELDQMARFETERHIPFHQERHSSGYHVMRDLGVEGSEVLLGAVDGPIVERAVAGAVGAGLTPAGLTLSSVALVNALLFERREAVAGKTVAALNIGLDALDLVLLTEDRVRFARSVSLDLRSVLAAWANPQGETSAQRDSVDRLALAARSIDCMDLEARYNPEQNAAAADAAAPELIRAWIQRLILEVRRTYDFARREMKCPPIDLLFITGCGARLRNLPQYLTANLSIEVAAFNPVGNLPGAAAFKFAFDGLEYTLPFGAALMRTVDDMYLLDLIPPEHYRAQMRRGTLRRLAVTGGLLLVTLVLAYGAWVHWQSINQRLYNDYAELNDKMRPKVAELDEMSLKLGIIKKFQEDPNAALTVLSSVAAADMVPSAVVLTSIDYSRGTKDDAKALVEIQGDARTIPDINNFMDHLRESGHFNENMTMTSDPGSLYSKPLYHFKIVAPLSETSGKAGKARKAEKSDETRKDGE